MGLTTVQSDGWRATYTSPPSEFTPVSSPETLSVTRAGFDATGTAATPADTITIMKRVRLPYPDQATLTATDVALSDFVYSGDTIAGITNSSTLVAPLPICMWLDHDLQRCTTGTYTAKLAVAHAHARSGRPVAAVKFSATDGTTTVEQTVSAMSNTTYAASGLTVPHFEADLDFSTLTDNAMITIDVIVYPWVGAAYQASVNGATYPSANFCEMKVLNDVSYGTAYAYVDPVSGVDADGVTSETPATAQATPYLTPENAAKGIESYNTANFSRSNASGGIVRLEAGTSEHNDFSEVAVGEIPLVIEAADPTDKTATRYQHVVDSHRFDSIPDLLKFKDITLVRSSFNRVTFDNGATVDSNHMMVLENVTISNVGGASSYVGWMQKIGRLYVIGCDGVGGAETELFEKFSSSTNKRGIVIGSSGRYARKLTYHMAGSSCSGAAMTDADQGTGILEVLLGRAIFHNFLTAIETAPVTHDGEIGAAGLALVGSVFELSAETPTPLMPIGGTTTAGSQENVVIQGNTAVGQRANVLYADPSPDVKRGFIKNNIFIEFNTKSDVHVENADYIGNWAAIYKVGYRSNAYLTGGSNADTFGAGSWLGEVAALGDATGTNAVPLVADFVDDASFDGSGLANGDYAPGAATELPTIPAGQTTYPVDLYGNVVNTDGTAYIGSSQRATSADVSVSASTAALVIATQAATISLDVNVATASAALVLAEQAATITSDVNVAAGTAALTLATFPVSLSENTEIAATTDALTLSPQSASVSVDVSVGAETAALVVAEQAASITLGVNIAAGTASLTLAERAASVSLDANVDAGTADLVLAAQAATIETSGATEITATTAALTLTTHAATLTRDINVAAETAVLVLETYRASLAQAIEVQATTVGLEITTQPAAITFDVGVAANTDDLTLATNPAVVTFDRNVATSTAVLTISTAQAIVTIQGPFTYFYTYPADSARRGTILNARVGGTLLD